MRLKPTTATAARKSMTARTAPDRVIFSDLDVTFLDHYPYSFDEALQAFYDCRSAGVPIIFCTRKIRSEMERLPELGSREPFIAENGGTIFVPRSYFPFPFESHSTVDEYQVIQLGAPYATLTSTLDTLSQSCLTSRLN